MIESGFRLVDYGSRVTDAFGLADCYAVALPPVEDPQVSVIIPMHNQLEYTLKCLRSLADCAQQTSFEVIVIDDRSDLAEFRALSRVVNLRVLRNFENQGFLRSCNRAVSYARGKYVVLLNNDTEVTGDWLDALLRVFETRADAGLVGSKLIYPDGTLQEAGGIVWQDGGAWNYGRGDDASKPAYNYVRETDYCSAASVMLPTELWRALGGFDLRYVPAYCEDSDLAFRVREAGYKVYVQPKSVVVHHEGKSNGTDTGAGIKQYQVLNHRKLVERWGAVFAGHRPNGVDVFKARERSLDKPVILFIDHYLPHFDQDAGSRTIWAFVRLFLREGFSVKFLGDNFYPHQPYQQIMEEMGIEVLTGPWMAEHWQEWLRDNGKYLDYVMLSRAHTSQRYLQPLRETTQAKILYYGHDLISRTARNQYAFTKDPAKLEEAKWFRELEGRIYEGVDVVYYPSQLEIEELAITHPQVNAQVVTPYVYEGVRSGADAAADRLATSGGLLFVGGFRHPPNVEAVLWFCREVMPVLVERLPGIHLTIAGSHPPAEVSALAGPDVTVTGYVSDEELEKLYRKSRLVVVPLLTGGGIKGKVIEALSHAVPIVTTPTGAEGILEAETAMHIVSPDRFAEDLVAIYNDLDRLGELVARGSYIIEKYYSFTALRRSLELEIPFLRHEQQPMA
jgi:GT2 family glycosyltransferase